MTYWKRCHQDAIRFLAALLFIDSLTGNGSSQKSTVCMGDTDETIGKKFCENNGLREDRKNSIPSFSSVVLSRR